MFINKCKNNIGKGTKVIFYEYNRKPLYQLRYRSKKNFLSKNDFLVTSNTAKLTEKNSTTIIYADYKIIATTKD